MATVNTRSLLKQQAEGGKFNESGVFITTPTPGSIDDRYQTKILDGIDTHKSVLQEIIEALKDESIQTVGIYGIGGVGKTTLAKEAAVQVKNLFDEIVFVPISHTEDVKDITKKLEVGAKRINNKDKVLIILDDIWRSLDLTDLGIPCTEKHSKYCKILLTSRNIDVYGPMNVNKNIAVKTLKEEEAWVLFKRIVGEKLVNAKGGRLEKVAKQVTKRCDGLPLFIEAFANVLKIKHIDTWKAILGQLENRSPPAEIKPAIGDAFTKLRLSYDLLQSKEAKSCFLLCSMFKEDGIIDIQRLTEYGVGQGIFKDIKSINDAENRVRNAVDTLTSCGLLLSEENEVKMHDVFRDLALVITSSSSEDKEKFFVNAGTHLTEWQPIEENLATYTKISLMDNIIISLPKLDPKFPLLALDTFLIRNNALTRIPEEFVRGMKDVKVLDVSHNHIKSLPISLKLLTKLITLDLNYNKNLKEISIVGKLKVLQILKVRGTGIEVIPEEIGQLTKLRLLDAGDCECLSGVPSGVISKLTVLEELYIVMIDHSHEVSSLVLKEISKLGRLRALGLDYECHLFPEDTNFERLPEFLFRFNYEMNHISSVSPSKSNLERRLHIQRSKFPFTMPIKKLVHVSDGIVLCSIEDLDCKPKWIS